MFSIRRKIGFLIGAALCTQAMLPVTFSAPDSKASFTPAAFYDELRNDDGTLRPQYQAVQPIYESMSPVTRVQFLHDTRRDFRGDNALSPLPRILTQIEFGEIERGVKQRGTALRMFLQDYYSGRNTYRTVIPEAVLERIIARAGESGLKNRVLPHLIAFPYGPDIIRAANGNWSVIEDNPGFIGGPGDLVVARESLLKNEPRYKDAIQALNDPMDYYREIVRRARARARPRDGAIVLYAVPPYPDNEDNRLKKLFSELGVRVITPNTKDGLIVGDDGVYIRSRDSISAKPLERVGYVILNGEHKWIDPTDPEMRRTLTLWYARELLDEKELSASASREIQEALNTLDKENAGLSALERAISRSNYVNEVPWLTRIAPGGLFQAILDGKVGANYSPGVDFIGDKEFYLYVEDLIRLYLGEEPILKNLQSRRFGRLSADGHFELDEAFLRRFFESGEYRSHVVKVVDGRGGDGIYIGPKLEVARLPEIVARIRARPEAFIVQPYSHLSVLGDSIVDLRAISDVSPTDVFVSGTPWSRGVPRGGDGKVNLSAKGHEYAVIIVDGKSSTGAQKKKPAVRASPVKLDPRLECFAAVFRGF